MLPPDRPWSRISATLFGAVLAVVAAGFAVPAAYVPAAYAQSGDEGSITDLERQAEQDRKRARKLEKRAQDLAEEIRALRSESVSIARRAQKLETELSRLESTFRSLKAREAKKLKALGARQAQMTKTLAALQRIAIQPPEAVAMSSRSPLDVVRGASVLGETVPVIEDRAQNLRGELVDLRQLRREMARQRDKMADTRKKLEAERGQLQTVMVRKQELRRELVGQSESARESAIRQASKAEDMRDLLKKLRSQPVPDPEPKGSETSASVAEPSGSERAATPEGVPPRPRAKPANLQTQAARLSRPEDIRPFPKNRESLRMPASGQITTRYGGQLRRAGGTVASKGVIIETRNGARVVAPYDGKVAYAGPFKGYGRILIIEHRGRYHSLLAGLDQIDAIVGQWVLAGEPVGVMPNTPARTPDLYMELRRAGRPINPLPWLAQTGNKVKG